MGEPKQQPAPATPRPLVGANSPSKARLRKRGGAQGHNAGRSPRYGLTGMPWPGPSQDCRRRPQLLPRCGTPQQGAVGGLSQPPCRPRAVTAWERRTRYGMQGKNVLGLHKISWGLEERTQVVKGMGVGNLERKRCRAIEG